MVLCGYKGLSGFQELSDTPELCTGHCSIRDTILSLSRAVPLQTQR